MKLKLEDLGIESFATEEEQRNEGGSVQGYAFSAPHYSCPPRYTCPECAPPDAKAE
jgi:hypothetical protein